MGRDELDELGAVGSVELEGGGLGYVEPIYLQPLCVQCHGESVAPEVASALLAAYPDDKARDYRVGDFRGLFWAEVPALER